MLFYRVWHVAPFAFIVFYAGLQTVDQDTLESSVIDGASRLERLRYVTSSAPRSPHHLRRLDPPHDLVSRLRRDHRLLESGAPHFVAMAHLLVSCPRPDRESRHLPRLGVGDADNHRRRVPADAAADAVLARPSARVLIVSARYLRQPLSLKFVSALGLAVWTLVAIFPLLWIATMSFRMPLDAFSPNPVQVLIGPHTKETNGGPSMIGVLVGGLALWLTYAAGRALLRSRRHEGARRPWTMWLLAGLGFGAVVIILFGLLLPSAVRTVEAALAGVPMLGALANPLVGITTQHYRSVWIDHAFYRQFLNSMLVTGGVVLVSVTVGTLAGYALARTRTQLAFWILMIALIFRAMPPFGSGRRLPARLRELSRDARAALGQHADRVLSCGCSRPRLLLSTGSRSPLSQFWWRSIRPFTIWMLR